MANQYKTTRLLSGRRVTMPQEWIDRNEIKDGDTLIIENYEGKTIKITKAKLKK